jgi:hypothetical protein
MWYNKINMTEDTPTTEKTRKKQPNTIFRIYENWDGRFRKLNEVRHLIPAFKDFYYEKRLENPKVTAFDIINQFNKTLTPPETFFPYTDQYRRWRKGWDMEIAEKLMGSERALVSPPVVAVKTRDENNNLLAPTESELEGGAKNLAGELMNDAMTILRNDQQLEELYDDEIIVKRRNYVINVFNYVMRAVHSKQALDIKANAEKRETAGFLMDLIRRSTTGKISADEISLLKSAVVPAAPTQNENVR